MKPRFYMLIGLSGSGKSKTAELISKIDNAVIFSSDEIRKELYGDENCQKNPSEVFEILHRCVRNCLQTGKNVVYDATNLSMKRRKAFLESLKNIDCEKICFIIATPFEQCVKRDKQRKRTVGIKVISKQRSNFQPPFFYEGWDKIGILNENKKDYKYFEDLLFELKDIEHDNPHHKGTIGEHIFSTEEYCARRIDIVFKKFLKCSSEQNRFLYQKELDIWQLCYSLAKYHDIGKLFTKKFKNSKGEKTDIAHYYNHQNVSAYEIISHIGSGNISQIEDIYECKQESLEWWLVIAVLVCWHMEPFFKVYDSKAWKKFSNIIGKDLEQVIKYFHLADINSG